MKKLNTVKNGYVEYEIRNKTVIPKRERVTSKTISPGIYTIDQNQVTGELEFSPMSSMSDQLIVLPDSVSDKVYNETVKFWKADTKNKFKQYGLVYKRGILLYGNPGTGKTCTISRVMEQVVKDEGIVFFNPRPVFVSYAVKIIQEIQPDLKILVVFEEFDKQVNGPEFLSLLDGESQVENVLYIATTNYIDRIPPRVKNRPSRFATVIEIGKPSAEARKTYLEHKLMPEDQKNIEEWIELSEGMVIDQLKDLIVSVCCLGLSLKTAVQKIKGMKKEIDEESLINEISEIKSSLESPAFTQPVVSGSTWSVCQEGNNANKYHNEYENE